MVKLLDHGSLELVESWGSDERVIEAARMSTGKGFLGWGPSCRKCGSTDVQVACEGVYAGPQGIVAHPPYCRSCGAQEIVPGDEKLLRYLHENKHATPFEMAGAVIEVQAPIFVFREWHRHRTQSYNEMSARYAPLPDVNYVPTAGRLLQGGGHLTKQAGTVKGAVELTELSAGAYREILTNFYVEAERLYQTALVLGVPKELARICLPVGRYSRMRASANLRNWLAFMTLRSAPNAQYEIRVYSHALHDVLKGLFPRTIALFDEGAK